MQTTAKERVVIERDELSEKLEKLTTFIDCDKFQSLSDKMKCALIDQERFMQGYLKTLNYRLEIWDNG